MQLLQSRENAHGVRRVDYIDESEVEDEILKKTKLRVECYELMEKAANPSTLKLRFVEVTSRLQSNMDHQFLFLLSAIYRKLRASEKS